MPHAPAVPGARGPRARALSVAVAFAAVSIGGGSALARETPKPTDGGAAAAPPPQADAPPPADTALAEASRCLGVDVPAAELDVSGVRLRLGVYFAGDAIERDHDDFDDGDVVLRDLRPIVEARSGPFSARVEGDLVGVDTPRNLYEAWAAWDVAPCARVSVGQFRVALGSEFATHEQDLPWMGYSFPAYVDGRHDVGGRIDGTLREGLWYQAAAVAGHGFGPEGHRLTSSQISVRAAAHPFQLACVGEDDALAPMRGLHFGLGVARLGDGDDPVLVSTPLQTRIFATPDLGGDDGRRVHLEVGWTYGPVQVGFERVVGRTDGVPVAGGGSVDVDELTAFAWGAAWNLTGEPRGWRDGAFVPETGPRPPDGLFRFLPEGRWELGLRYSNADIDRRLFDEGYASYDVSSQETRTFTTALFWAPCDRLRLGVEWVRTIADDAAGILGRNKREHALVARVEVRF